MRKISVVMPTFNRPQMVNRAILAILSQDYDDWELIIQNGGDSIADIIPQDDRIRLFEEKDKGITDAMNRAMSKATGDIFVWANDDDEIDPGTFKWIDENLTKGWGYGVILMTGGGQSFPWGNNSDTATLEQLIRGNFVPQPSVYWTREAYEAVGPMDERQDLTSDYDYWIRLWKWQEPQKFERKMATYHLHADQITQKIQAEQIRQAGETSKKHR